VWSDDLVRNGQAAHQQVRSIDEWIGAVYRDGKPVSTLTAWRDHTGQIGFAGMAAYTDLASMLDTLGPNDVLVSEFPIDGWFALNGATVRPLNRDAKRMQPEPTTVESYAQVVADRYRDDLSRRPGTDQAGGLGRQGEPSVPTAVAVALAVAGLVALAWGAASIASRRRQPSGS